MPLFGVSFFQYNIAYITRHSFIHLDRVNPHIGIKNYTKQIKSDLENDAVFFFTKETKAFNKAFSN